MNAQNESEMWDAAARSHRADHAALDAEYSRVITARFVTKRDGTPMHCVTCNAVLVQGTALAAVNDAKQWHSYCPACAADWAVQIRGLFARLIEMACLAMLAALGCPTWPPGCWPR